MIRKKCVKTMNGFSMISLILLSLISMITTMIERRHVAISHKIPAIITDSIWVNEGETAKLPCDLSVSRGDKVNMILWYKDDTGIPIYSVDGRQSGLLDGTHLTTSDTDIRYFVTISDETGQYTSNLTIRNVASKDEGIYKCRVDYFDSPTKINRVNLTLIEPPTLTILDEQGRKITDDTVGPYYEGGIFQLTCSAYGGKPRVRLTWILDDEYTSGQTEVSSGDQVENHLLLHSIPRSYNQRSLRCRASAIGTNNKYVEKSVRLNIYVKPTSVVIVPRYTPLIAGKSEQFVCESTGSNPPPDIEWFLDGDRIKQAAVMNEMTTENNKRSTLSMRPEPSDNGKVLTCRSKNPHLNSSLEDRKLLEVHYVPLPKVSLMSKTSFNNIKEGEDLSMNCIVDANPAAVGIIWYHNDKVLRKSTSDTELKLSSVSKSSSGTYECEAYNDVGTRRSRPITVNILHPPVCNDPSPQIVLSIKNELVILHCEVDSDSEDGSLRFYWTFNNTKDVLPVPAVNYQSSGRISILKFTPTTDSDFGNFGCWAQNSVGRQNTPCLFSVMPARKPERPENCTIEDEDKHSEINCAPGYDGGQKQYFILEVRRSTSSGTTDLQLVANDNNDDGRVRGYHHHHHNSGAVDQLSDQASTAATDTDPPALFSFKGETPKFSLDGLPPMKSYSLMLYAINIKGRSDPVIIVHTPARLVGNELHTQAPSQSRSGVGSSGISEQSITVPVSYLMIIIVALILIFLLTILTSVFVFCKRSRSRRQEAIQREVNHIRLMFSNNEDGKADTSHVNFETEF